MGILSWTKNYGNPFFMNFRMSKLGLDEAYLKITKTPNLTAHLYSLYNECFQCPFTTEQNNISNNHILTVSTHYAKLYRVLTEEVPISPVNSNRSILCTLNSNFGEYGVYSLEILENTCVLKTLKEPVNIYFPILTVISIYALITILTLGVIHVWKTHWKKTEKNTSFDRNLENSPNTTRLRSLDTFRGINIVIMLFLHYGGGDYAVFEHAIWNGLHLADVLFPCFLWIMGVCIPMSVSSRIKHGTSKKSAILNVLRRSCILFGFGLFLGAGTYLPKLRVLGVLQRCGICYFAAASAFILFSSGRQVEYDEKKNVLNMWRDIFALKYQWMVGIVLLIIHTLFTFMLPVPDCPKGYLGPGGLHSDAKYNACTGGAAGYIDKVILGNPSFEWPTMRGIYQSGPYEPTGILGCLTSTLQVIIGAQAGAIVLHYKGHKSRLVRWLVWGVALGLAGGILCGFSKENGFIPVNKHLWSLSFVMVTSSLAFLLLAFCYYVIEAKDYWSGKPFLFAGMNSIFIYVGHIKTSTKVPIRWPQNRETSVSTHFTTIAENVWSTGMWVLIAYYLYRKKFFLHV